MSNEARKSVWAVESGSYSDYRVNAVFSTEARAQAFANWQNGPRDEDAYSGEDEYRVVEWALDEPFTPTGCFEYSLIATRDGRVIDEATVYNEYCPWNPDGDPSRDVSVSGLPDGDLFIEGFGPTKEHAMRSVREMARAIKAGTYVVEPSDE